MQTTPVHHDWRIDFRLRYLNDLYLSFPLTQQRIWWAKQSPTTTVLKSECFHPRIGVSKQKKPTKLQLLLSVQGIGWKCVSGSRGRVLVIKQREMANLQVVPLNKQRKQTIKPLNIVLKKLLLLPYISVNGSSGMLLIEKEIKLLIALFHFNWIWRKVFVVPTSELNHTYAH